MHVGMGVIFQNPHDARPDVDVYRDEVRLALLAEPLGLQSIWGVEHHFTDYTMCPDVLQHLAYFAGRTKTIQLGSMVVVLPWHQPMRVAEQVAMLDNLSDGRVVLGLGRGLGRVEFDGFGVPMEHSRGLFYESAHMLIEGLERGWCEFDGELVRQPRRDIRPRPLRSFRGRTYAAAVSPESAEIMARLGVGILIIPQKPWDVVARELDIYRRSFAALNGVSAPPPITAGWVFCDRDAGRAEEKARQYIGEYWRSVVRHYEFTDDHLARTRGYESYSALQERVRTTLGQDTMADFYLDLQVWGTPEMCYAKTLEIQKHTGCNWFTGVFSYGGMPIEDAQASLTLFAQTVAPELQRLSTADPLPGVAAGSNVSR